MSLPPCHDFAPGELQLGVAASGNLRWAAVELGALLEGVRARLDLSPLATVALGRSLASASLLHRFTLKHPGQIVFEVVGDGPLGRAMAEFGASGRLRGYVGNPRLETPPSGRFTLREAIGRGTLKVLRTTAGRRYDSQVRLVAGEIGQDLVHYLEQSEQIRSAALLGELFGPEGVRVAGGMLVEALPGTEEETLERLEDNIAGFAGVQAELERGGLPALLSAVLEGFDRQELERHPLRYGCADGRERIAGHLGTLSARDLDEISDPRGLFTAECAYCGAGFTFSRSEVELTN